MLIRILAVVCLSGGLVLGGTSNHPKPEVEAHRGENTLAPENTMPSFKLAWARGDDAIELDIHLTSDGKVIVCHDANTKRTTNQALAIKSSTFEQLEKLDAGSWKDPKFAGTKLPLLSEVLATIPDGKRCFIEIKVGPEIARPLKKVIEESGKTAEQTPIISFHAPALAEAKKVMPDHACYLLSSFKKNKETGKWTPTVETLIKKAKGINADGIDVSYKGPVDRDFIQKVHSAGLKMYVWVTDGTKLTWDTPEIAKQLAADEVDGITTNKAHELTAALRGRGGESSARGE
jgi:glycerophosphoryl diester phosphodiesterase